MQKKAKPIERLKQSYADFLTRVPSQIKSSSMSANNVESKPKYEEIPGYDTRLLGPNHEYSFGERRAEYYRQMGWEKEPLRGNGQRGGEEGEEGTKKHKELCLGRGLKDKGMKEVVEEEDELDNLPFSHAVNPDDLTHISVYRDNTMDIKELKELALKAKQAVNPAASYT